MNNNKSTFLYSFSQQISATNSSKIRRFTERIVPFKEKISINEPKILTAFLLGRVDIQNL
jgi:hypothetical protein